MSQRRHLQHLCLKFRNPLILLLPKTHFSLGLPMTSITRIAHPPFPGKDLLSPHQRCQQHRNQHAYRRRSKLPQPRKDEATKPEEPQKLAGLVEILLGLYTIFPTRFRTREFEDRDEGIGRGVEGDNPDTEGFSDGEVEG